MQTPDSPLDRQRALLRQVLEARTRTMAEMPARWGGLAQRGFALGRQVAAAPTEAWPAYARDFAERWVLTADALRQRGNQFVKDERAGHPPLLKFPYETLIDGRSLARPVNYSLLRIVDDRDPVPGRRPYVIIDPRAGHGAGIGGFKPDSQVGVALAHGHPVYFVAFHPRPEPDQTIADITAAEAHFLKVVAQRHPEANKPVVVGNCQGGWAAMLLAASNPELTGVVMVNGAPLSYWAGVTGKTPMRYLGGLFGGALPAAVLSDLGNGQFDGANLVLNFESNSPGRTWFRKYYDLFDHVDQEAERFLDFERWWSGYYFLNEREIRWIVENLFIGNRLATGQVGFKPDENIDLRRIESPVIVFASHGDDITPPQQALNWIADAYASVDEIKAMGRRIAYMIDDNIGHLGIFVSAQVARQQHNEMAQTIDALEALPPGLYEMILVEKPSGDSTDGFRLRFEARTLDDLLVHNDGRDEEACFEAVSGFSQRLVSAYEQTLRPVVKSMVSTPMSRTMFALHPLRLQRYCASDSVNPSMRMVEPVAEHVRSHRAPVEPDNPFRQMERLWADSIQATFDAWAQTRDLWFEMTFFSVWASPWASMWKMPPAPAASRPAPPVHPDPDVLQAAVTRGGFPEAVTRMLLLVAAAGGKMLRSRLIRATSLMRTAPHFRDLDEEARTRLINEQTQVVHFDPSAARAALPMLLPDDEQRRLALRLVHQVVGPQTKMTTRGAAELDRQLDLLDPDRSLDWASSTNGVARPSVSALD